MSKTMASAFAQKKKQDTSDCTVTVSIFFYFGSKIYEFMNFLKFMNLGLFICSKSRTHPIPDCKILNECK